MTSIKNLLAASAPIFQAPSADFAIILPNQAATFFPNVLAHWLRPANQVGGLCPQPTQQCSVIHRRLGELFAYSFTGTQPFAWNLQRNQQTPQNSYCQVVITKAGTNVTMYLNGQIAATSQVVKTNALAGQNLQIGRSYTESPIGNSTFHGVIDDVRIYNRAFSTDEVTQLYAMESAPIVNVRKAVYLDSSNLWVGTNYQVQMSSDLINWTNSGAVFNATSNYWHSTNYWDVADWNQLFFRLKTSPWRAISNGHKTKTWSYKSREWFIFWKIWFPT